MTTYKERLRSVLRESISESILMEQPWDPSVKPYNPTIEPEEPVDEPADADPTQQEINAKWLQDNPGVTNQDFLNHVGKPANLVEVPTPKTEVTMGWPILQNLSNLGGIIFGNKPIDFGHAVLVEGATEADKNAAEQHNEILLAPAVNKPGEPDPLVESVFENLKPG